ncbi:hypothetical protein EVAR_17353_1 [Eumeta japonica]|uniref:Glycosyltransferase family 92 protein n=1 Tax=Eumeta variegata TaxID=151549 RepID=A0A4C1WHU4_EUMVA|nr:hypothetical protein EVAR_17353_1 [Eumeta japonica]
MFRLRYVLEVLNFFGKPGLSEIEFCGPGFNATLLSEILRNTSMEVRETPPIFQQIDENFYMYSSFLKSYQKYEQLTPSFAHEIDTIVVGKASIKPSFRCNIWLEDTQKPKPGRFSYKILSHLRTSNDYTLYIFNCGIVKDLGKPRGISFYLNDYNINPIYAPVNKVIQVNTKRKLRKKSNIRFVNSIQPTVCVIPNKLPLVSRDAFIEFLVFHHMMGVDHFTIYDSTISEDIIRRLNLLPSDITQWSIQFFPLNYPFVFAKSYEIVRSAIELDCLFRHFKIDKEDESRASHAIVLSWDEFITPRYHNNIKAVLDDFDPTRNLKSITFNVLLFCMNQKDDDKTEIGYPEIAKKTHYYNISQDTKTLSMRNLDSMTSFEDITKLDEKSKAINIDTMAIHKYMECRDVNNYNLFGYNETQLQMFPHKFEGAMSRFRQNLMDNKIYRLYRTGEKHRTRAILHRVPTGNDFHHQKMLLSKNMKNVSDVNREECAFIKLMYWYEKVHLC